MRQLTGHKVNPVNDLLTIEVVDAIGHGGANHEYRVAWPAQDHAVSEVTINFQNGPIAEHGVNGLTHEALLVILIDRLSAFQAGPYANPYNGDALYHVNCALETLHADSRCAGAVPT